MKTSSDRPSASLSARLSAPRSRRDPRAIRRTASARAPARRRRSRPGETPSSGLPRPGLASLKGKIKPQVSNELVTQIDFLESFSSLIGSDIKSKDGVDLSDVFFRNKGQGRTEFVLEATSRTAFRQNNWVMIPPYPGVAINPRVNIELGNSKDYLLFNLDEDISQQNDLSKSNPEKLNEMIARYEEILGNNKRKAEKLELE